MEEFWNQLSSEKKATELDVVLAAAWLLSERFGNAVSVDTVCDEIETSGLRLNINRSRLRKLLRKSLGVSLSKTDCISITRKMAGQLAESFSEFVPNKPVQVLDSILAQCDFSGDRPNVISLVRQINGCYQQEYFDGCAVLMRRLVETLAIEAFDRKGHLSVVKEPTGEIKSMSGVVATLKSGRPIKLGRGANKSLDACKEIGDRAAHNRWHVTSKLDVDHVAVEFRSLISELKGV